MSEWYEVTIVQNTITIYVEAADQDDANELAACEFPDFDEIYSHEITKQDIPDNSDTYPL